MCSQSNVFACEEWSFSTKILVKALNCFVLCENSGQICQPLSFPCDIRWVCQISLQSRERRAGNKSTTWMGVRACVCVIVHHCTLHWSCTSVERVLSSAPGDSTSCSLLFSLTIFVLFTTVIRQYHGVFLQQKQKRSIPHFRAAICR